MTGFITAGTPCDRCFIPMRSVEDQPTVVETDHGQVTAHWACLPLHVQEQVLENQKRQVAPWN